jgi:hypothetical protein
MSKLNIPTDFLGKWYFTKETLNTITNSEDFNLKDFCQNLAFAMLMSEESHDELNEALIPMKELASTIVIEVLQDTIKSNASDLPDEINLDSMTSENDEVILDFSFTNKENNNDYLKIKKLPSNDILYGWDNESKTWSLVLIKKPVVIPDDFIY